MRNEPVGPGQDSTIRRLRAAREAALDACAARDRFNAIAAHELRQPLAALMVQADVVRRLGLQRGDAPLQELGEDMRLSLRRQARLIEDLLDVYRIRMGKLRLEMACVDLGPLVSRVSAAMAATMPSVCVRLDIPADGTLRCHVDPIRIEQIVSNLVENALKFAGARGTVNVRAAVEEGHARIVVSDTGRGIAAASMEGLFELFARHEDSAAGNEAGMGIGLAVVNELVMAHGGRVHAHSAGTNRGAEFSVWLPLADAAAAATTLGAQGLAATPPVRAAAPKGRRRKKRRGTPSVRTSI